MRRWNLLFVAALLAAVLFALSGPKGAIAASTSTTSFKGKPSVYYRNSGPYFVVNFTCSGGKLSGNWTYDTRTNSFSGTLGTTMDFATCVLVSGNAAGSSSSSFSPIHLYYLGSKVGTLTLALSNISASKTYISDTSGATYINGTLTCPNNSSSPPACIQITTTTFSSPIPAGVLPFDSTQSTTNGGLDGPPYGTLNLS